MINNEVIEDYTGMVNQVSSEYKRMYPMVDREDITQELWLWFITHPRKFKEWNEEYDIKDRDKLIAKSLRNAAYDYCIKEKAQREGYNPSDNFWYTKEFVKLLIPGVLTGNWEKMEIALSNMGRSTKSPAESGDWMAHSSDIKAAFDQLDEKEQNLVFLFYGQDLDSNELHEQAQDKRGTNKATAMAANRALNKLVRNLGGFPPFKDDDYEEQE